MENMVSFDWAGVSAEAVLFCGTILVVLFESLFPKRAWAVAGFAVLAMAGSLVVGSYAAIPELSFGGTLGTYGEFGYFITVCALLSALLGFGYFAKGAGR